MIVRVWRGRTQPESAAAYQRHVVTSVFPKLGQLAGFLRGRVTRRDLGDRVEFLVITEWASIDAIRAFAGNHISDAVVEPAARALLTDFDSHVEHFEVVQDTVLGP